MSIKSLEGKIIISISGMCDESESVMFTCYDGSQYVMHHHQDCCENVHLVDVCGDVEDLIGSPVLVAEERTSGDQQIDHRVSTTYGECFTWTFYELATIKGSVTLRWLGESNGYYSEGVDFHDVNDTDAWCDL